MSTFDQEVFDNVKFCKCCNHNFAESYNGRKITGKIFLKNITRL